jgi:uncharacterized protein (DUF2342 family)
MNKRFVYQFANKEKLYVPKLILKITLYSVIPWLVSLIFSVESLVVQLLIDMTRFI